MWFITYCIKKQHVLINDFNQNMITLAKIINPGKDEMVCKSYPLEKLCIMKAYCEVNKKISFIHSASTTPRLFS